MNVHPHKSGRLTRRPRKAANARTGPHAAPARPRGRPRTGGRREEILAAALHLFTERGYHGTSIDDIATLADIAAGTIYNHFTSKAAIVNELFRACKSRLGAALATLPTDVPHRERFHAFWQRMREFADHDRLAFRFLELHHHASYLDDASRLVELQVLAPLAGMLAHARRAGVVKAVDPAGMMIATWGAFVSMIKHADLGYYTLTDALSDQIEAMCWDAIAA